MDKFKENICLKSLFEKNLYLYTKNFFLEDTNKKFIENWHYEAICEKLEDVYNGKIKRLIINIPPRYGKTELLKRFISWCFAKSPHSNFIYTSYSDRLVLDCSSSIRDTIKSEAFQELWQLEIKTDTDSKRLWKTKEGGGLYASSTGGSITGFGAGTMQEGFGGALIIDDAIKADDIYSETYREKAIRYYTDTLLSRLNNRNTPIIVIMQRLHEGDLTGYLLENEKDDWVHLKIPILDKEDKPLWEQKHNLEDIEKLKINSRVFAGQYMQEPAPIGGGIFKQKDFKYWKVLPKILFRKIYLDSAMKTKEMNDYTVMQCWGKGDDGNIYLIDQVRGKFEAPELTKNTIAFWNKHSYIPEGEEEKKEFLDRKGVLRELCIEDKSSGTGLIQTLRRDHRIPVKELKPDKDKVSRAMDSSPHIEAGFVYFPEQANYLIDLIQELTIFPNGNHDDIVDVVNYAIFDLMINKGAEPRCRVF